MTELWRPVVGYEGLYEVSSLGRVRSLPQVVPVIGHPKQGYTSKTIKGRVLTGWIASHGYLMVTLGGRSGRQALVHRLVCEAFHGPCPEGYEVCHGPNGKLDNRASQLRWGTRSENHGIDRDRDGTKVNGEKHHNAKLKESDVLNILRRKGESASKLGTEYKVAPRTIRDIFNGKTWIHLSSKL